MEKINILHITPHLGGGVGKALNTLVSSQLKTPYKHSFLLLEQPEKTQFLTPLLTLDCEVAICPDPGKTEALILAADIVQLEWWNHPTIFRFLCKQKLPFIRLLVWSHVSGIHTPIIPIRLIEAADQFVFTSFCSFKEENIASLSPENKR
jgi:hypothetical protein